MNTITIVCTKQQIDELYFRYPNAERRKTPPYAHWQIKLSDCVITAYESGKVVFQGESAHLHAQGYQTQNTSNPYDVATWFPQCGSDEVGTGDYFGPVVVCAAYVCKEDVSWLTSLHIQDSKAMKDDIIREVAPLLMERLPHSLLILNNTKYNEIHPTNHMVQIKCKLHNQSYVHLQQKLGALPKHKIIDQFVKKESYYRYLAQEKEVVHHIHFETKAENKFLSVAAGSVIARYAFLHAFDAMCKRYQFPFIKGASNKVDVAIRDFVELHGSQELMHVAKLHFANTKKAGITFSQNIN